MKTTIVPRTWFVGCAHFRLQQDLLEDKFFVFLWWFVLIDGFMKFIKLVSPDLLCMYPVY